MFKKLESKWNAHTPKILHPRTKENLLFQLALLPVVLLGIYLKDWWDDRQLEKSLERRVESHKID